MIRLFANKEPFATEDGLITPKNKNLYWAFGLVAGSWMICLLISGVLTIVSRVGSGEELVSEPIFSQFKSESEFRDYLTNQNDSYMSMEIGIAKDMMVNSQPAELPTAAGGDQAYRVSESNVQVLGIDEPDIVKTDGQRIFTSAEPEFYFYEPMIAPDGSVEDLLPRTRSRSMTSVIQALPVDKMARLSGIQASGDLLLDENKNLLVLGNNQVVGFDVSDDKNPVEKWRFSLESASSIQTARMIGGEVILVMTTSVYQNSPCPVQLWKSNGSDLSISCTEVWRPNEKVNSNQVYTIVKLDPKDGNVKQKVAFMGSGNQTVVYVSSENVYLTFYKSLSYPELLAKVVLDSETDLVAAEIKDRIKKVLSLEISPEAKSVEVEQIMASLKNGMSDNQRMRWEVEMTNLFEDYQKEHKREIGQTFISKTELDSLEIVAEGLVPGKLLNQFSMDEYKNHLRLATTVGSGQFRGTDSVNDVYVLDEKLKLVGKVEDLGVSERIYAVRFMGERGFVVTFRETDPLYGLDLADVTNPRMVGELKIPGYSSYLHPLSESLLVGIGKEGSQVKVSLFDVKDSKNMLEIDSYLLPDYWSDILSTHLAFLQDKEHKVFFVPASSGGYIFGYEKGELSLVQTIAGQLVKRALYINDNLYLISNQKITVVSEDNWEVVKTFEW